jgi:hypothetical protein
VVKPWPVPGQGATRAPGPSPQCRPLAHPCRADAGDSLAPDPPSAAVPAWSLPGPGQGSPRLKSSQYPDLDCSTAMSTPCGTGERRTNRDADQARWHAGCNSPHCPGQQFSSGTGPGLLAPSCDAMPRAPQPTIDLKDHRDDCCWETRPRVVLPSRPRPANRAVRAACRPARQVAQGQPARRLGPPSMATRPSSHGGPHSPGFQT